MFAEQISPQKVEAGSSHGSLRADFHIAGKASQRNVELLTSAEKKKAQPSWAFSNEITKLAAQRPRIGAFGNDAAGIVCQRFRLGHQI